MMLADPYIGGGMVSAVNGARQAAAASPPKDLRDWFDGATFHKLYTQGYFSTNACIALSISFRLTVFKHGGARFRRLTDYHNHA